MKHTQDTPFYRVSIENSTNQMKKPPEYLYEDIAPLAEAFVEALYEQFPRHSQVHFPDGTAVEGSNTFLSWGSALDPQANDANSVY